jgi:histidinol-phosphate/aromatic aminotransferase/cobyric acid decarboxylase-like protein
MNTNRLLSDGLSGCLSLPEGRNRVLSEEDFSGKNHKTYIDVVFLCNHNNPTGVLVEKRMLERHFRPM